MSSDKYALYDRNALRWEHAVRVCAKDAAIREEVERRTVFLDFDKPVQLVLLGAPLVVERDGEVAVACNVYLIASKKVRVVEFTPQEFSVFVKLRSRTGLSKVLWVVQRPGDGVAHVEPAELLKWCNLEDQQTNDLVAMYGGAALPDERYPNVHL